MLVASSGHVDLHNAHAHHDPDHGLFLSATAPAHATTPQSIDMEGASAAQNPSALSPDDNARLTQPTPVSLDQPISIAEPTNALALANGMDMDVDMAPAIVDFSQPAISDERVNAFARLRFDDGSYYMHTYQIVLGRNLALAHKDMRRLARVDKLQEAGQQQAAEELLNGNVGKEKKKKRNRRASRSVISEKGGIVNAPIESMPIEYQQRRQSNASHSLDSSSQINGENGEDKPAERAPHEELMQLFPQAPAQFDGVVPEDPNDCPLVPIHPQHITARAGAQGPKGISRYHAKIFFDFEEGHFCVEVLGSNGLHHEDRFLHQGDIVPLDHGDRLLIGAVNIQFYLPDNTLTEDQRHRQESGSRPMSFSFENGHGELESDEHMSSDDEANQSMDPRQMYHNPYASEEDSEEEELKELGQLEESDDPIPQRGPLVKLKLNNPYVFLFPQLEAYSLDVFIFEFINNIIDVHFLRRNLRGHKRENTGSLRLKSLLRRRAKANQRS